MKSIKTFFVITTILLFSRFTCTDENHNSCDKLVGDWKHLEDGRYLKDRYHKDGKLAAIQDYQLKYKGNDTIDNGFELLIRQSGKTGIVGSWKTTFSGGEWLIYYYNSDGSYKYEWNDGSRGNGYYTNSGSGMRVVEYRGKYECKNDSLKILGENGFKRAGKFSIVDTTLTVVYKDTTIIYTRL